MKMGKNIERKKLKSSFLFFSLFLAVPSPREQYDRLRLCPKIRLTSKCIVKNPQFLKQPSVNFLLPKKSHIREKI